MLRWLIPVGLAGLAALIAAMPLSWVAGLAVPDAVKASAPDLTYRGTIWNGSVAGLPVFGDANLHIRPLARRADLTAGGGRSFLSAELGRGTVQLARLNLDLQDLPLSDGRLQGLRGRLDVMITDMSYGAAGCESASGTARTDVLQRNGGSIDWTGPELSGPLRCEAGSLIADLDGRDAQQTISAIVTLSPDGSYRAEVSVRTSRQEADAVLPLFGFTRQGGDFVLTEQGRWR